MRVMLVFRLPNDGPVDPGVATRGRLRCKARERNDASRSAKVCAAVGSVENCVERRGERVDVAWRDGGRIRATGNSFAAPHLAGQAARLRSRYPAATPFEIKSLLAATATQPD